MGKLTVIDGNDKTITKPYFMPLKAIKGMARKYGFQHYKWRHIITNDEGSVFVRGDTVNEK